MRILVVDDEEIIRQFLKELLHEKDHDVITAADGAKGLAAVEQESPDLVISDINMPAMNGLEMLSRIAEKKDAPPVILLTGYGDLSSAIEALHMGAYDYMLKPVQTQDLVTRVMRVEEALALRHRADEEHRKAIYSSRMAAVGQLAAGVAHEVNNPTTFLRGNSQLMGKMINKLRAAREGGDADALQHAVDVLLENADDLIHGIETGTQRISRITHGLISFADSQMYEAPGRIGLNAVVSDAQLLMGEEIDDIDVEFNLAEDLPVIVGQRRALTQAILCLLVNARQAAADSKTKHMRVTSRAEGERLQLIVEDSGAGIPDDLRERVFEPFFTTREVGQGAGLGLSVAYGIIATDHEGAIELEDSGLGGAKFIVSLPVHPPSPTPEA